MQGGPDVRWSRQSARRQAQQGSGAATEPRRRCESLSRRELGILAELAMGTGTEQIAVKLHVSPHTVRTHVKNIMRKLDAHTRAHAVAIAYSENAIDPQVTPAFGDA